jgi:16S rRNA (cytosine967-C5)-methyltransferase
VSIQKPREITVGILDQREQGGVFTENLLEEALARNTLSPVDRSLAQELTYGIVRWQASLDWLIHRKTKSPPRKRLVHILLRLGLYQLFWLERIPHHATVNETVQLAKTFGCANQTGLINAILRGYIREEIRTRELLRDLKTSQPALGYSHPDWLWQRWEKRYTPENARGLCDWNNTPPKTFARVNTFKTTSAALQAAWEIEQVRFTPFSADWLPGDLMFKIDSGSSLATLPSFQQGLFYIQDPSTLLAVQQLDPQPGESILDMCAAPGGKTTFIAQKMKNSGLISAQDLYPPRLLLVEENCARLGFDCFETSRPSEILFPDLTHQFDRILIDAPCSNTGVMRRRVDLRWRIQPREFDRLRALQLELLHQATLQLKPGGRLVYSTCSLEPEENQQVLQEFLSQHPNYHLEVESSLIPFTHQVDGAYVARLTKRTD